LIADSTDGSSEPSQQQLTYHEPGFPLLMTITSFIYLLQVFRNAADYVLGAGLIGEMGVGVIYRIAKIIPLDIQESFIVIGYLGLVLIVFEGGLTISPNTFLPTLPIALAAALVGVLLPLGFTL
jgi:Kef-type K+ transport system membrane component KefB